MNRIRIYRFTLVGLVLCAVFGHASTAVCAATVTVIGSGYSSLDNGVNQTPFDVTTVNNPNGSKSVSGSGFNQATNATSPILSFAGASGEGYAYGAPGLLRVRIQSSADNMSFIPQVPFLSYTPRVVANFGASFADSITLTHPTLPNGADVTYRTTIRVLSIGNKPHQFGPLLNPYYYPGTFYFYYGVGTSLGTTYSFPNGLFQEVPDLDFEQSFDVAGKVGDVIGVFMQLGLGAESRAGLDPNQGGYGNHQNTIIDASNSAFLFIDPVTPGLGIASESGHDFKHAVPEPGSLTLAIVGLLLVNRRTRFPFPRCMMRLNDWTTI